MGMTSAHDVPIRDAATVILLREGPGGPRVLMGQRGAKAAFMPSKYVFPGGALDPTDAGITVASRLSAPCHGALCEEAPEGIAEALALAAVREMWEEAGLLLGAEGQSAAPVPEGWRGFVGQGVLPHLAPLDFIFRAVTPPGRPRRFDARFFLVRADELHGDPDDFSAAEDELSHLHWIGLGEARALPLPFITEVVLAEVEARVRGEGTEGVPFFRHDGDRSRFSLLGQGRRA